MAETGNWAFPDVEADVHERAHVPEFQAQVSYIQPRLAIYFGDL
jgi:hypothetical protein